MHMMYRVIYLSIFLFFFFFKSFRCIGMLLKFYLSGNLCNSKFLRSNLYCVIDVYDMQSNLFVCLHNFVFKCLNALRLNCTLNIIRENINRFNVFLSSHDDNDTYIAYDCFATILCRQLANIVSSEPKQGTKIGKPWCLHKVDAKSTRNRRPIKKANIISSNIYYNSESRKSFVSTPFPFTVTECRGASIVSYRYHLISNICTKYFQRIFRVIVTK